MRVVPDTEFDDIIKRALRLLNNLEQRTKILPVRMALENAEQMMGGFTLGSIFPPAIFQLSRLQDIRLQLESISSECHDSFNNKQIREALIGLGEASIGMVMLVKVLLRLEDDEI